MFLALSLIYYESSALKCEMIQQRFILLKPYEIWDTVSIAFHVLIIYLQYKLLSRYLV